LKNTLLTAILITLVCIPVLGLANPTPSSNSTPHTHSFTGKILNRISFEYFEAHKSLTSHQITKDQYLSIASQTAAVKKQLLTMNAQNHNANNTGHDLTSDQFSQLTSKLDAISRLIEN
jgi:hypothetical protein